CVAKHGDSASATRDHKHSITEKRLDHRFFMHLDGHGAADHAAQSPIAISGGCDSLLRELARTILRQLMPHEFGWTFQSGIVLINHHLRQHGDDAAVASGRAQCVLQRLLDHVANPSGGCSDEYAEWQGLHGRARLFVANELIAYLRTVAVNDAYAPAILRQRDDRSKTLACMSELIEDRGPLTGRRQCVATERNHRGSTWHSHQRRPRIITPSESKAEPNARRSPESSVARMRS